MNLRPNPLIYGEFDRLVPIRVLGRVFEVPEGIPLIRAFQYIQFELGAMKSDWSLFCFNDTIGCCTFRYRNAAGEDVDARACCLRVEEGLEVIGLPEGSLVVREDP
ncbi:MAG: hypothetical protein R3F60_20180 [bacterium]